MEAPVVAVTIALVALVLGVFNAVTGARQRVRQEDAAVTGDLYPILRVLRDAGWQYAKPLGGQRNEDLVTLHYALIDLRDLRPAVRDKLLRDQVDALLQHDVAGLAMSIDPPRFVGATFGGDMLGSFHDFAKHAHDAVERCQGLRRGAA
jgi:hypothetical protein